LKYKQKLIAIIFVLKNTAFSVFKIKNKSKVLFCFIFDFMIVRFVIKKYDCTQCYFLITPFFFKKIITRGNLFPLVIIF